MTPSSNVEELFKKGMSAEDVAHIIMMLNTSSSRRLKTPLSFSYFVDMPGSRTIDLYSNLCQYHLTFPRGRSENDQRPILHNHEYFELMFVERGAIEIQIEDRIHKYHAGDICLFNQNIHHAELWRSNTAVFYSCITKNFLDNRPECGSSFYPKDHKSFSRFFENNYGEGNTCSNNFLEFLSHGNITDSSSQSAVFSILLEMKEELLAQRPGFWLIIYGLFARLLYTLADPDTYRCNFIALKSENLADTIRNYIETSPDRLSREDIAQALHYNSDYLNRIFHQRTGITLSTYLTYTYMKKAANLLLQTNDTVGEIAEAVGFSNPSQFYRQFRRYFHMTPQEYRSVCTNLLPLE